MILEAILFEGQQFMRMMAQPGLEVRAEPLIGGNDLQDLSGRHLLHRLGGLADRHRANKTITIQDNVSLKRYVIPEKAGI